ncbi:MAG: metallophosphoesterase [Thermomicrobiales bacterium]|nr:metallophosphoesterase [Thermomicrobiales bacterium]
MTATHMRIAAIGDLHVRTFVPTALVKQAVDIEQAADVLIIAGDITNGGRILEVEIAAEFLDRIDLPKLCVLGNHDRRTTRRRHYVALLREAGVRVLDGDTVILPGFPEVGFAGVGGSGGGFWPEEAEPTPSNRAIQAMAVRARREAARLDKALNAMETPVKVAILHFAPTTTTLVGEPVVKYPLLGNSALGRVVDKHQVDLVFHGHSHIGSAEGVTPGGVPVRNVAASIHQGFSFHSLPLPAAHHHERLAG